MTTNEEISSKCLSENTKIVGKVVVNTIKLIAAIGGLAIVFRATRSFYGKEIISLSIVLVFLFSFISDLRQKQKEFIRIIPAVFILIFFYFCAFVLFFAVTIKYFPTIGSRVSPGIAKEKVLSLKIGMNKNEVINIMGNPIKIDGKENCGRKEDNNGCSLVYATPGLYGFEFDFYLNIIDSKLVAVHVERNDFFVYSCFKNRCPGIVRADDFEELFSHSLK